MIYVLDTDILSLLGHNDSPEAPRIHRRIAELPTDDTVATTIITFEEQMRGWMGAIARAKSVEHEIAFYARLLQQLVTFRDLPVLGFDAAAAQLASCLKNSRLRMGSMDIKIASITLSRNAILITRNVVDFGKVPDLTIEDWSI